ncbi:zinc finger 862-like [Paramuricea clavata]|uniref:Zinc finger 862-like n=1 Tax=Paramuricea clavata TaxID=317549 RepID=A0A6S7K1P2_PARCT|nr:zinc finger 862-like [Paramuricea clavata]
MSKVIPVLVQTLKARFANYDDAIYSKTRWLNPELWCSEREYGIEDITAMAAHFAKPLEHASFNLASALKEWHSFKIYVRSHYPKLPDPKCLWKSVLSIRREEFPNLCKLASLAICISGSNSTAERTFSVLTNILSDKHLSMRHSTLDDSLIVYGNDGLWSVKEKEESLTAQYRSTLKQTTGERKLVNQRKDRNLTRKLPVINHKSWLTLWLLMMTVILTATHLSQTKNFHFQNPTVTERIEFNA